MEGGRMPELALIVVVERTFFHCGKCITRSNLWDSKAYHRLAAALPLTAPAL